MAKRVILCTLFGTIAGGLCAWLGAMSNAEFAALPMVLGTVFNRAFIGTVIGISGWKTKWAFHGVVLGLVGTLPLSIYPLAGGELKGFLMLEAAGAVWGLLIELGAQLLKAKQK